MAYISYITILVWVTLLQYYLLIKILLSLVCISLLFLLPTIDYNFDTIYPDSDVARFNLFYHAAQFLYFQAR